MSMNVSLHPHSAIQGQEMRVQANVQHIENRPDFQSAILRIGVGINQVDIYFENIEQIDLVLFHMGILSHEARDAWNTSKKENWNTSKKENEGNA